MSGIRHEINIRPFHELILAVVGIKVLSGCYVIQNAMGETWKVIQKNCLKEPTCV